MEWDNITMLVGLIVTLLSGAGAFFRVQGISKEALRISIENKKTIQGEDGMGGLIARLSHAENEVSAVKAFKKELDEMKQKQDKMFNIVVQIAIKNGIDVPFN